MSICNSYGDYLQLFELLIPGPHKVQSEAGAPQNEKNKNKILKYKNTNTTQAQIHSSTLKENVLATLDGLA
jgi:hypothetical protein